MCSLYYITCSFYYITCSFYYITCSFYYITCSFYPIRCSLYYITCSLYYITCSLYYIKCFHLVKSAGMQICHRLAVVSCSVLVLVSRSMSECLAVSSCVVVIQRPACISHVVADCMPWISNDASCVANELAALISS